MGNRRSAAFERALKIEMLRARAAIERKAISNQAGRLCHAIDPRVQIANFMPRSASGLLGQLSQVALRYPFLLSSGATLLTKQLARPKRILAVGAAALAIWFLGRNRTAGDE